MNILKITALTVCLNIPMAHANDVAKSVAFSGYFAGSSLIWVGQAKLMKAWQALDNNPGVQSVTIQRNELRNIQANIVDGATYMVGGMGVMAASFVLSNMLSEDCDQTPS